MAVAWKLLVVYVCENNLYGISVDIQKVTNTKDLAIRALAYDIPGVIINGSDVLEVYGSRSSNLWYLKKDIGSWGGSKSLWLYPLQL